MSYPDFETFYNENIAKERDIVSKKEVTSLWNRLIKWVEDNPKTVSRDDLYEIVRDENNLWMNFPKFYRKRAIILCCLDAIAEGKKAERFKRYIEHFTIREFYFCIDYKKISFFSCDDMKDYVVTNGNNYRTKLKEDLMSREFKTRDVSENSFNYSYDYVLLASELIYSGMTPKQACSLKFENSKFYLIGSKKEFVFSKYVEMNLLIKIAKSKERVTATGRRVPNYHVSNKVFGAMSEQTFRGLLREFNKIAPERELSINSIERTALFCNVRDDEKAIQLTTTEKMEYESWMKAFS